MPKPIPQKTSAPWLVEPYFSFLIASILGLLLLIIRLAFSWNSIYFFLAWNLILAWIPLILADILVPLEKKFRSSAPVWVVLVLWLLFFPNAPYILTDYFHLINLHDATPLWFDLILISTFAWLGLILGFASLTRVQNFITKKYSVAWGQITVSASLFLASFGIFVGRYLRWNSWDVVANPAVIISDLLALIQDQKMWLTALGVTVFFTLFLAVAYRTVKIPDPATPKAIVKKR